ncbi:MAG TPA: hypothetical protein PLO44_00980 [Candidatus Paceibacterota bacterium]|nr:hypothetical protein [Candidatus Paceibacterota bacterium]
MKTIYDKSAFVTILLFLTTVIIMLSLLFPKFGITVIIFYGILYVICPIIFMAIKPKRFVVVRKWLGNFLWDCLGWVWVVLVVIVFSSISIIGWTFESLIKKIRKAKKPQEFQEPS